MRFLLLFLLHTPHIHQPAQVFHGATQLGEVAFQGGLGRGPVEALGEEDAVDFREDYLVGNVVLPEDLEELFV
jgi:hypothetical protein